MKRVELLAPAGNSERLKTAVYFGADAVYFAGQSFGLRAVCDNFADSEIKKAIDYLHAEGKKAYITANIFAKNSDLAALDDYFSFLESAGADAVIIADLGVAAMARKKHAKLPVHLSTQANTTNMYSAEFAADMGIGRIVLARELFIDDVRRIYEYLYGRAELEAFVHGAMCISYSGRCLLSNYLTGRDSNRGECVQACRWEYKITEISRSDPLSVYEDISGTYLLNSKDLNLLRRIGELAPYISSFKIEGRVKTAYYVATIVNAYRRALDSMYADPDYAVPDELYAETLKTAHRDYTEGFMFNKEAEQSYGSSRTAQPYDFAAIVHARAGGGIIVQMRNKFTEGDVLEVLSPGPEFNKLLTVRNMRDEQGKAVSDAKLVQQMLFIPTELDLRENDILRKRVR